eukprot:Clim_evm16s222 gene=Clim_evmTU16s222
MLRHRIIGEVSCRASQTWRSGVCRTISTAVARRQSAQTSDESPDLLEHLYDAWALVRTPSRGPGSPESFFLDAHKDSDTEKGSGFSLLPTLGFSRQKDPMAQWTEALVRARSTTGYSSSLMGSLNDLLVDEFGADLPKAMAAKHLAKLTASRHPVVNTVRHYLNDHPGRHTRGTVVLLMSKALSEDAVYTDRQRKLAEITEMIHIASLIHRSVTEQTATAAELRSDDLRYGNKISVLGGDFLLAKVSQGLSQLHNLEVVDLMSQAIEHWVAAENIGRYGEDYVRLVQGAKNSTDLGKLYMKWSELSSASLFSKACRSTALLEGHDEEKCAIAESYGRYFGLASRLIDDLEDAYRACLSKSENGRKPLEISAINAVLILNSNEENLWEVKDVLERITQPSTDQGLQQELRQRLLSLMCEPSGQEKAQRLLLSLCEKAREVLEPLPLSEAKGELERLVMAIPTRVPREE